MRYLEKEVTQDSQIDTVVVSIKNLRQVWISVTSTWRSE